MASIEDFKVGDKVFAKYNCNRYMDVLSIDIENGCVECSYFNTSDFDQYSVDEIVLLTPELEQKIKLLKDEIQHDLLLAKDNLEKAFEAYSRAQKNMDNPENKTRFEDIAGSSELN